MGFVSFPRLGFALAFVLCMTGCAETVRVPVEHPPIMPVRVYASVIVLHRDAPNERQFAEAIAAHLRASSDATVQVMTEAEIARLSSGLPPGTVVFQMRIDSTQSMRLAYVPSYGNSCGMYSCMPTTMTTAVPVVTVTTRLTAMLRDGATAQILVTRSVDEEGDAANGTQVFSHLFQRLVSWVDGRRDTLAVSLRAPRDARVERAIDELGHGRFGEARTALEAVVAEPAFANAGSHSRARTLFALAVARRFDPSFGNDVTTRFASARDACGAALALHDAGDYRRFCGRLASDEADARALGVMEADAARLRAMPRLPIPSLDPASPAAMFATSPTSLPTNGSASTPTTSVGANAAPSPGGSAMTVPDPSYAATR